MAWLAADENGEEWIYSDEPQKVGNYYYYCKLGDNIQLPKGSIKKLVGRELTFKDEPVELK